MEKSTVCIYGAGAIGLDLAWHVIRAGHAVTIIARDQTRETLERNGIKHMAFPAEKMIPPSFRIVSNSAEAGVQRYIFLTTKVDALLEIAPDVTSLIGPQSLVISATNGIPPWFSHLQDDTIGRFTFPLEPRQTFLAAIPPDQLREQRNAKIAGFGVWSEAAG